MDATGAIQESIHVFSLVRKCVSRILGTYHLAVAFVFLSRMSSGLGKMNVFWFSGSFLSIDMMLAQHRVRALTGEFLRQSRLPQL